MAHQFLSLGIISGCTSYSSSEGKGGPLAQREPGDHCLRMLQKFPDFWEFVYFRYLSGLRDAIGLNQQITVYWRDC